ncbi:Methyltransferase-like protein 23 [Sparganum proliferum]
MTGRSQHQLWLRQWPLSPERTSPGPVHNKPLILVPSVSLPSTWDLSRPWYSTDRDTFTPPGPDRFQYFKLGRAEYASYTWRSAECLAQAIALGEISVTGKRILELGAGTGLCGLTALKCGATWTTFSDLDDELILESLNESCRNNGVTAFDFIASDWNNVPCELLNVDFDLILAADCMFDKKVFRPFAETVSFLLHKNPSASAVVAYENRG